MKFYAYHGVSQQEARVGNYFMVDVSYSFHLNKASLSDDLFDTISYADIYNLVKSEMMSPSKLLEHVAGRILHVLKSGYPQLSYVKLKLSKLNPPLGGEVYAASVIIEENW